MAKRKLFGSVIALAETTIEKAESVVNEGLSSIEYGAKAMTNVIEEFHNDTMLDVLDSRLALANKLATVNQALTQLGFNNASDEGVLSISRRPQPTVHKLTIPHQSQSTQTEQQTV